MKTFLQEVAHDLYQKTGGDFSHVAVVFPNKRASLFFNEHLVQESERPLWSPSYISISELFRQNSPWQTGDPIKLICDLYKIFRQVTGSTEPLDDFYFWGEMLIADFDDADKNMADTDALFSNLKDLNALTDNYDFLEEGQKEALAQFFHNFSIDRVTELKQRFISIWDTLGDIYTRYKALLENQGIAYEGMMYRQVIETMDIEQLPYKTYVFVGFNVAPLVVTLSSRYDTQSLGLSLFCCGHNGAVSFGINADRFLEEAVHPFFNGIFEVFGAEEGWSSDNHNIHARVDHLLVCVESGEAFIGRNVDLILLFQ